MKKFDKAFEDAIKQALIESCKDQDELLKKAEEIDRDAETKEHRDELVEAIAKLGETLKGIDQSLDCIREDISRMERSISAHL